MNRILLFFALPVIANAAGCDAAVGEWKWFSGGSVTLTAQKAVVANGKPEGRWECSDPNRGGVIVRWNAGFVDHVNVSGNRMTGKNQQGVTITADRKNASPRK